jgi:peptidoglycan/LPS O-acetylase OafA/YrhL
MHSSASIRTLVPVTTVLPPGTAAPGLSPGRATRQRLDHVDAMRPIKQFGVVATHSLLMFTPAASGLAAGAALMLLHVTREAFLFISACMLTYSYYDLKRDNLKRFWRRRFVTVGIPYLCWTVIYFLEGIHGESLSTLGYLHRLGFLLLTGYYQLYFLVVLLQFYFVFPAFLWVLRRTRGHHALLLVASGVAQITYLALMRWSVLPEGLRDFAASREIMSYQFYLLAGALAAVHYAEFDAWIRRHRRHIVMAVVLTAAIAETWYFVQGTGIVHFGAGLADDPFQPIVVPWNIAAILGVYLIGVALVSPDRSRRTVVLTHMGSDDSYGVYLAQMLFIYALSGLGWKHLDSVVPWPIVIVATVLIVFVSCCVLTEVLARTPVAEALTGRKQEPWHSLVPGWIRRATTASAPKEAPDAPPADSLNVQDPI